MILSIDIPADVEAALRGQLGPDWEQRTKRDLAASWFRDGRLTSRQVATLLGVSLFEAHEFLKGAEASLPMSMADVESDLAALRESRGP
jgi:Uncharacterised protein family (UPF0175)